MELGPRSGGTETHFIHQKQSLYASHYTWSSNHNRDKQKFGFPLVVWIPDLSGIESPKCRSPRKRPYEILEEIFEASLRPAKRQKEEVICLPPCPGTESGITGVESIEMEDMSAALPVFDMMRDGGGFIGTGDWGQSLDSVTDAATPPDLLNIGPSDSIEKSHTAAEEWVSIYFPHNVQDVNRAIDMHRNSGLYHWQLHKPNRIEFELPCDNPRVLKIKARSWLFLPDYRQ